MPSAPDLNQPDTIRPDTNPPDTNRLDTNPPDTKLADPPSGLSLSELQRWFLEQVVQPHRTAGLASAVPAPGREVKAVIAPSSALSSEQRMHIYAEQYILRLQSIARDRHPTIERLLGKDAFLAVVNDYLSRFPPHGYTLNNLCNSFPYYIERYVEHEEHALLCEVAMLERAISDAFDTHVVGRVRAEDLAAVPAELWPVVRFRLDPSVRLMTFDHDVIGMYDAVKEGASLPSRMPKKTWAAVWRHEGLVWRQSISRPRHAILSAFADNQTVTVALERAAGVWDGDEDELAQTVFSWFSSWVQEEFFSAIIVPSPD